ncbi:major facilitator superfamily domain-containing protein 12-like [Clytia hemisphaerica]
MPMGAAPSVGRLPTSLKLTYGVGHVLNDLCASMWFSYMLLYMHKVVTFNNVNAGFVVLAGQIADAISTPFVGLQSDKTYNVKYGRRKIWHLVGVICVTCSFPFIFHLCVGGCANAPQYALMVYYIPFIVIFQFGWASTQISHLSLIPELTHCQQGKVELNAIRYFATVLSNLVVFFVCFVLFELKSSKTSGNQDLESSLSIADADKFFILATSVVALGVFFMVIFHLFVKEPSCTKEIDSVNEEEQEHLVGGAKKPQLAQKTVNDWFKTPVFYKVGWLYMMTRLIVNISQVYLAYFVTETLKLNKSAIAIAPAVVYVTGIFASLIAKKLNRALGLKFTYFFGLCFILAGSVYFYFMRSLDIKYRPAVYGACVCLGLGGSTLLINSLAMISQMIGRNVDTSAFVYGSMSLLDKFSNGAAIMLIQFLHPCKDQVICCYSCQLYYRNIMSYFPGVCAVLAFLVLMTIGKNTFENPQDMNKRTVANTVQKTYDSSYQSTDSKY